jgi:hypothetical protein
VCGFIDASVRASRIFAFWTIVHLAWSGLPRNFLFLGWGIGAKGFAVGEVRPGSLPFLVCLLAHDQRISPPLSTTQPQLMDAFGLLALESDKPWLDFNDARFNPASRCRRGLQIYFDAKNNTYKANPYQNRQASAHVCFCHFLEKQKKEKKGLLPKRKGNWGAYRL